MTEDNPLPEEINLFGGEDRNFKIAKELGIRTCLDLSSFNFSRHLINKIPYSFVKKHTILPLEEAEGKVVVAIADPLKLEPIEELRHLLDKEIETIYCPKDVILLAIGQCYDQSTGAASELIASMKKRKREDSDEDVEVYDLLDTSKEQSPIVKLLNLIITEAIQQGASDIHLEPYEDGLRVRYRIDGVLQKRHTPAAEYQAQLLTRVKVMARLDIAERRLPQDGRIKLRLGTKEIDFRVSTVPVAGGERIVMRILDKSSVILGLNALGMPSQVIQDFRRLIALPEGIILVTGPTGSGKTTTLYSAINEIYNDKTNIMTIEDPVEYKLKGISQIGVKPKIGLNFASGLRHILRQDPDIIMVGEIRDIETASIAIQSSLTGHLVLSTLHTNDAPSAITRLVDMGIEPYLLSSTIVGVLAQRLVRRICSKCIESYKPGDEELIKIGVSRDNLKDGCLYKGKGCSVCFHTGYKGRHGLYELMLVGNDIKKQIIQSPDAVELRKIALQKGMLSLFQYGLQVAAEGKTTIEEVLRVTRGLQGEES